MHSMEDAYRLLLTVWGPLSGGSLSRAGLCPKRSLLRVIAPTGLIGQRPPRPCGQTDTCKNITLAQT